MSTAIEEIEVDRYSEQMSLPEKLLVLALKDGRNEAENAELLRIYERLGDEAVAQAAARNKITPMVGHALMEVSGGMTLPEGWSEAHRVAMERNTGFFRELEMVAQDLLGQGISLTVVENGGVLYSTGGCRGCFASNDMEVLVLQEQLPAIDTCLKAHGYERDSRERCLSERLNKHDYDPRGWVIYRKKISSETTFWLNVMWRPVIRRWVPAGKELSARDLLSRSVKVSWGDSPLRVLSSEDQLLLCALHTASHSYVRGIGLRLQMDVDRLVRRLPIDWDLFLQRVGSQQVKSAVFPSLAIPRGLWNTPISDGVLKWLVPSRRKRERILRSIAGASVFNRDSRKFGRLEFLWLETMLCDHGILAGLRNAMFPSPAWMREEYGTQKLVALPYYYARRLAGLALRQTP